MPDFKEQIARGMALLDSATPRWIDRINLRSFDITEPSSCVLGQVYGDYLNGKHILYLAGDIAAIHYGFFYSSWDEDGAVEGWNALNEEWKAALQVRKWEER